MCLERLAAGRRNRRDVRTVRRGTALPSRRKEGGIHPGRWRLWRSELEPSRTIGRLLGNVSWLREWGGLLRSPFACSRFPASRTIADAMVGNHRQQRINQRPAISGPGGFNLRGEGRHGLRGTFETHLARLQVVLVGGHGHHRAQHVVRQHVSPDFFANHLGRPAAEDIHLHRGFDRPQINFALPTAVVQIADLLAVDRHVENRGDDFELLDAVSCGRARSRAA